MEFSPVAELVPEVSGYTVGPFVLREDLERLSLVNQAGGAPEAVILYCSRILETSAGDALRRVGQTPSPNVFSNLQLLEDLSRIGDATRYWAHALRRLGNAVRHVFGRVGREEASLSILFVESWLEWFFCRFSHGTRLRSLTKSGASFHLTEDQPSRDIIRSLETLHTSSTATAAALPWNIPGFFETSVFPSLAAEILLSRDEGAEAFLLISKGLHRSPDDIRLQQLAGIYWSRSGDFVNALGVLEPLRARSPDDGETAGIIAGVYKRKWQADRGDTDSIDKSYRTYRDAWKRSGRKSVYLGINAATMALLSDRAEESRQLAAEVEDLLRRRAAALPPDLSDPTLSFNFWDRVTLAEALLLLGKRAAADETYAGAFASNPGRIGDIDVCQRQRDEILRALGLA